MPNSSINPLSRHFRQPALYIKLTSGGKYWADGALELPGTGELPVLPMTTKDEIILRTPDALVNGTSVVQVIESCCPNIKDAWAMPSIDVDSTLIAIRIASYGQHMPISSKCPACEEENDYDIDLAESLSKVKIPDYVTPIVADETLTIQLKPMPYSQVSKSGGVKLEEEKLILALANPDLDEELRIAEYDKHVKKMISLNLDNIVACTESITADGIVVTNPAHIREYYANAEAGVMRKINTRMESIAAEAGIKPHDATCNECGHQFKLAVEFDYSNFFAKGF
jgi:hypothetical protein